LAGENKLYRITFLFAFKEYNGAMDLAGKEVAPCDIGVSPLPKEEIAKYVSEVGGWSLKDDGRKIEKKFTCKDFKAAMVFINTVADVAEQAGHHPDIHVFYNKITIELWTHAIGGLSRNDFIVAARIDQLPYMRA